MRQRLVVSLSLATALVVTGCAFAPPAAPAKPDLPAAWDTALPEPGPEAMAELARWWQQFDDPLLSQLIDAAQALSPTVASAGLRIEQARQASAAAGSALRPGLDAQASASRGRTDPLTPIATVQGVSLQASWELDVFGANRAARRAAQSRWDGARAGWHDARVVVAAEVAQSYLALRTCEALLVPVEADARSRQETATLTASSAQVGLQTEANAALARASAAQGQMQLVAQRAQCQVSHQALVALTGWTPQRLRTALQDRTGRLPQPKALSVVAVPAQVLAQRPDVFEAERTVLAAEAEAARSQALRYPRIGLQGSVGRSHIESAGASGTGSVWSVGPVSVTFPVLDGGLRQANVRLAQAQVDEARVRYAATLRRAVQEVEESLIQLRSAAERQAHAQTAVNGFSQAFLATQARFRVGSASLLELEDTRRSLFQAQSNWIGLKQSQVAAWITLYRALGGGWTTASPTPDAPLASLSPTDVPTP